MTNKIALVIYMLLYFTSVQAQQDIDFLKEKIEINRNDLIYHFVLKHRNDENKLANTKNFVASNGTKADILYLDFYLENSKHPIDKQDVLINKYLVIAREQENWFFVSTLYMYKAFFQRGKKEFALALENFLYAYDESTKDKTGNYYHNSFLFQQMGLAFLEFKDYEKALKFGLLAHETKYFNDPNKLENWLPKATANLIGEAYRNLNKTDSAIYWFKECFNKSQGNRFIDTLWRGISLGSIAEIYTDKKEYTKALVYYIQGKKWHKGYDYYLIDYNINTYSNLAKVYLAVNNVIEADKCLKTAATFLSKREYNNCALKYYETLVNFYKQKKVNASLLLNATDSLQHYNSIVAKEFNEKQKISIEATMAFNNQLLQTQIAETNYKKTRITLIGTVSVCILLLIIIILYTKRRNLYYKLKQQQTEREKEKAKEALSHAKTELKDFAKNIHDKNQLIDQFTVEVENLKLQSGARANEKDEIIYKLKQSVILTEADWLNYKVMFDKVYPQHIENIKAQFTSITNAELRYLMLKKLNLDNKEMAATLGIGLEAVRNLKFRVKNKIGTDTDFFDA